MASTSWNWPSRSAQSIIFAVEQLSMRCEKLESDIHPLQDLCFVISTSIVSSQTSDAHMFDVNMSLSWPCRTSPLKYDTKGPCPVLSFCSA